MDEADLTPAELAAFHAALERGELSDAALEWTPWWHMPEAGGIALGKEGLPLIQQGACVGFSFLSEGVWSVALPACME